MINTNIIYRLDFVQNLIYSLERLEKDRNFCKHHMEHFLSVARICYILCLENSLDIDKDLIYSAALLHDLGRVNEILDGTEHNLASVEIAERALAYTSFSDEDKKLIISAIKNHRRLQEGLSFESLFYKADKLSRTCFNCLAENDCNWPNQKKNLIIKY
ncbi:MAG: HD domain-containing protein [Tissierellia bacterium]|nr:HD domain-containing protein [Tissierellia bacterium]